jgi:CubicO group peptidase (beta-lactamase class C family)
MSAVAATSQTERPPRQRRAMALEGMISSRGDDALRQFIDQQLAPSYRDSFPSGALLERLRAVREAVGAYDGVLYGRVGEDGMRVTFITEKNEVPVLFRIDPQPPNLIVSLELEPARPRRGPGEGGPGPGGSSNEPAPYTWETLADRLDAEAKAGFSGTVLVARGGKIVLHQGYGMANREKGIPNTVDTIFAIGSIPIDFTRAAVLKLEEKGKLKTSDPITRFLKDVPPDKREMTIDHLMSGASGLPNFHHILGVDDDADLSWIDRKTAVKRILSQDLLFAPGHGEAHSHSAWVLLAAVVEIASGKGYGDFLRESFFEPAGMTRTGLHEEAARFADDQFAVGYEGRPVGALNIPKNWGRTSWLVMGSGGMQSTPMDLYRWLQALRARVTLSAAEASKYWTGGMLAGGDQRGFFCLYTEGPDPLMILCSNAQGMRGGTASAVADRLARLVMPPPRS